jgi:hypothetical protein
MGLIMRDYYKRGLIIFLYFFLVTHFAMASKNKNGQSSEVNQLVTVNDGILSIDGQNVPIIYGAEIQYFRLRGGAGKNLPKKSVIDLWNRVLDRVVEAEMNAVSISIPWDFHEYVEGKFDFDGTVDEDHDGNPDYPSRDLKTFFKLVENHKIKIIMIKPGPYIKADWGFSGEGAVPLWFHENYPDSHMMNSDGLKNKLFDYNDEVFQNHVNLWFQALYREVLFDKIGLGKPIKFLQLDNESNYNGQNILQIDYSARSIKRYQNYLKDKYPTLNAVNRNQGTSYVAWESIKPPIATSEPRGRIRDWYDYLDYNTGVYLERLRKNWEALGVDENQILFTAAENYSATEMGILPNSQYRNNIGKTGLMTVNLFPKTYYSYEGSLLNYPFKGDIDIKNAAVSSQNYFGDKNSWVMGSEVEFGWKKGAYVTDLAKKQIYVGALGQGMKAFFMHYFADGWNWQWDWLQKQVQIIKKDFNFSESLTAEQWKKIQAEFEIRHFTGVDLKALLSGFDRDLSLLDYDGALDINGNPNDNFQLLKAIGQKIIHPYGAILGASKPMEDFVSLWHDPLLQLPNYMPEISSNFVNSEWSGSLIAILMEAKIQPTFTTKSADFPNMLQPQVIFSIDGGSFDASSAATVSSFLKTGGVWVNFLGVSMLRQLGYTPFINKMSTTTESISLNYVNIVSPAIDVPVLSAPIYAYTPPSNCRNFLTWKSQVMAFICTIGRGTFIQMGALLFEDFNADSYASPSLSQSKRSRISWFENLFRQYRVASFMEASSESKAVSAVGRIWEQDKKAGYLVTLRSAELAAAKVKLIFPRVAELIKSGTTADYFQVSELFSGANKKVSLQDLKNVGFEVSLPNQGSEVLMIAPILK